ncbi:MAG TPA: LytTR family DNA-binding domain-containing protein, partial [Caulobacteraceae bacterium]|nr:LytTR family DNA-binding domain-containing protein [Caulobacteraceae bacterium]
TDGRTLLSTASLAQTLETLPGEFVRVHKSWAVNADHVTAIGPRPGGGRGVTLSDGSLVPVGRAWTAALARFG